MHIALIGSARFGAVEPYAGGLESHVAALRDRLRHRGHEVTVVPRRQPPFDASGSARRDVSAGPRDVLAEHHAYLECLLDPGSAEIFHNHSLHYLPIAMARALDVPMVTTLHSPPTPWLESAFAISKPAGPVVSVSVSNASQWLAVVPGCGVVPNGVDLSRIPVGPGGGGYAAWFGRLVPEKGAEHAIAVCRSVGLPLRVAGPIHDPAYFDRAIRPHLGSDVRYEGHLSQSELARLVGSADVVLVTPRWDEPYGLVVAESLAAGTPVAAYGRGGVCEILTPTSGCLAPGDDVDALAAATRAALELDRADCRQRAEDACDIETMVDRYEAIYLRALAA